ncbi:2-hydroxyacid dehydrogenase [Limobrevibacterium gyesilva]|uniref:2-hydroxyacid dehydrogenase n=1 Tax=Limobrevibacterium gyesilva TaxID=2991712 RepID=A0AA41YQW9_9PROT|nr:2-hydroxyacid dehydrogenase [Limobrevibacterium gyesilva]MCW3477210.1 2-hydroxyacid dehydrogenase [Limobrevibacterium gyesilva]
MTAKIVLVPLGQADVEISRGMAPNGYDLVVTQPGTPEFRAALADMKYLVGLGDASMDDAFYRAAPNLKLVQLLSAGYDRCDVEAARRAGVPIANNGGANAVAVAEHALMLMLAVSRRLIWQHGNVAGGRWRGNDWNEKHLYELHGKTLGIVGLGTIGKKVARLGRAFGMDVQYYDIARLPEDAEDALGARFRLLREVLKTSDVVSLHVPLTAATRHMIGAAELALMQPSAILINTCRGPVVDEAALHAALAGGGIAAAGLDVFEQEPPRPDNPLFGLENVILTAHLAGPTWENRFKRFRNAFDNVQRVERGETPLWVIPELRA